PGRPFRSGPDIRGSPGRTRVGRSGISAESGTGCSSRAVDGRDLPRETAGPHRGGGSGCRPLTRPGVPLVARLVAFKYLTGTIVPIADREWAESMPLEHLPNCFGCGSSNPDRLGIQPRIEGDKVVAELVFEPRFEGGPGLVHGGATAAF